MSQTYRTEGVQHNSVRTPLPFLLQNVRGCCSPAASWVELPIHTARSIFVAWPFAHNVCVSSSRTKTARGASAGSRAKHDSSPTITPTPPRIPVWPQWSRLLTRVTITPVHILSSFDPRTCILPPVRILRVLSRGLFRNHLNERERKIFGNPKYENERPPPSRHCLIMLRLFSCPTNHEKLCPFCGIYAPIMLRFSKNLRSNLC